MFYIMRVKSHLIVIAALTVLAHSLCPTFSNNDCTFTFANASCSFFACSINYLVSRTSDHGRWTVSYVWQECTARCCSNYAAPNGGRNIDLLVEYCENSSISGLPTGVTVAIALGFVLLVVLSIGFCMQYFRFLTCSCPCFNPDVANARVREGVSQLELLPNQKRRVEEVLVTEQAFQQKAIENRTCSICIQNDSNLGIQCGHYFHGQCLWEWTKKKRTCPQCRTQIQANFVVYCVKCLKNYQKTNQLKQKEKYLCLYCQL